MEIFIIKHYITEVEKQNKFFGKNKLCKIFIHLWQKNVYRQGFVKSIYFKKEPSLIRKLLFCIPYFFSLKPSRNTSPTHCRWPDSRMLRHSRCLSEQQSRFPFDRACRHKHHIHGEEARCKRCFHILCHNPYTAFEWSRTVHLSENAVGKRTAESAWTESFCIYDSQTSLCIRTI